MPAPKITSLVESPNKDNTQIGVTARVTLPDGREQAYGAAYDTDGARLVAYRQLFNNISEHADTLAPAAPPKEYVQPELTLIDGGTL
jgi:hypothetical protein